MRAHWRNLIVVLAIAGPVCACHSRDPEVEPVVAPRGGLYRFAIRTVNGVAMEGKFMVLTDTVTVDARPGPCAYVPESSQMLEYRCADMSLMFDRADPVSRSKYKGTITITEQQTVCLRFVANSRGVRACAETSVQYVDRRVSASGRIEAIPDSHP